MHIILHEVGHTMGLGHHPALHCPDGVFSNDLYNQGNCSIGLYSNYIDPMSGKFTLTHFPAYFKWALNFLPGKVVETTLLSGQSKSYSLYDSTQAYYGNYTQLLLLRLDDYDTHLTVEYRRPVGFNNYAVAAYDAGFFPIEEGVYVGVRLGQNRHSSLAQYSYADLYTPYHNTTSTAGPEVVTTSKPLYDPNLGISIEVAHSNNTKADIIIRRD